MKKLIFLLMVVAFSISLIVVPTCKKTDTTTTTVIETPTDVTTDVTADNEE